MFTFVIYKTEMFIVYINVFKTDLLIKQTL
jgi:hypothetical protein